MQLATFPSDIHDRPLRVLREENRLTDAPFGIYGQKPFTFRDTTQGLRISFEGRDLAEVCEQIVYYPEKAFVITLKSLTERDLPGPVWDRITQAAQAVVAQVRNALTQRDHRIRDLDTAIDAEVGPVTVRKAKVEITTPQAMAGAKALVFPGVAARVLPEGFKLEMTENKYRHIQLTAFTSDPDEFVRQNVVRIHVETGHRGNIYAMGPGDRKPARVLFTERILEDAAHFASELTRTEAFRASARVICDDMAPAIQAVSEGGAARGSVVDQFCGSPLMVFQGADIGRVHPHVTDLGAGFTMTRRNADATDFTLCHAGAPFYDRHQWLIPGGDEGLRETLLPALALRALARDPNFRSRDPGRAVLDAVPDEAPEDFTRLLDGTAPDPEVELYL